MEASRKSRTTFLAASSNSKGAECGKSISSVKKALDFNFLDVEGVLHLENTGNTAACACSFAIGPMIFSVKALWRRSMSAAIVRVIVYVYVLMISQDELEEYMKTIFGAKFRWLNNLSGCLNSGAGYGWAVMVKSLLDFSLLFHL
ncbi:hypothetical protein Gotri_012419 [Gossypium trilobum]|uniref:Uncharacterized protein n=1 Tax=Gossypium trilobum TaxID=34281 RepID=A0A7J9DQ56_9ROSI|nr:hypothetical protein [Gossypium trilobum]